MSTYQIDFKLSNEFSVEQWKIYAESFNKIFKRNFTIDNFKTKYAGNPLGYSFHGVLSIEGIIVGMFTAIPRKYIFFGKEILIALGCDAFILPEHRKDEMFLKQMADVVADNLKKHDILYLISIPNTMAYPYWKYFGGWKDIALLNYYIVPLHFGTIVKRWKLLNPVSYFLCRILVFFSIAGYRSSKQKNENIHLLRDKAFFHDRYSLDYSLHFFNDESGFVYRVYDEEGVKTAYIIDCFPSTKRNLSISINTIIKEQGSEIDLIMFIGKLKFAPICLFQAPKEKEPRKQPFIGLSLDKSNDKVFYDIQNWEIGLVNFDNR